MYVAICDDNMADRHQMERLLKRESDRRASSTGILYIDSFGNSEALFANPMRYDVYYIDICRAEGFHGADVAAKLIADGILSPIVLCCSDIDYRSLQLPDNVYFLDKPLRADRLSESISHALQLKSQTVSQIELRNDTSSYYVTEPDILYAVEKGRYVTVTLTDNRRIPLLTDAANFFDLIQNYETFLAPTSKVIINGRHITVLRKNKAVMADGEIFKIHRNCLAYAQEIFEKYH